MAHRSENSKRLLLKQHTVSHLAGLKVTKEEPNVVYLQFPPFRTDSDAANSKTAFEAVADFCGTLHE